MKPANHFPGRYIKCREQRCGALVGLISGSGKSTILRSVSGMIKPWSGTIHFDGNEVSGKRPHEMTRPGLAHIPMGRQLFGNLTVHENLLLGAFLPESRKMRERITWKRCTHCFPT
jgi:branched-chain amino acid transport system ATP-binding protein